MASLVLFAQMGSVHFSAAASPDTVFVRQQVTYEASLRIREASPPRFLVPPQYTPAGIEEADVYQLPFDSVRSVGHVTMGTVKYTQYTYRSAIFPLTAGVDTIPSSTLTYTAVNEADPYASESTTAQSKPRIVVVLPLPTEGQPADFSGEVGQFTVAATADGQLSSGRAFTFRVRVTGTGDLALLRRPSFTVPWATAANLSDSLVWDSTGTLMHGFKEFRWLVTPQSGGRWTIPPVRFTYFNPTTASYVTTVAAAIPLAIAGDSVIPPRHDSLSVPTFSTLMRTLLQPLVLLLGVVVLAGAIVWGAVRQYRIHNS